MTLQDLIRLTADATGKSIAETKRTVMEFSDQMAKAISDGETIELRGLFTIKTVTRVARTGRNPQTGKPIEIPARLAIVMKASKQLLRKHHG